MPTRSRSRVIDRDRGGKAIFRQLKKLAEDLTVQVGVLERTDQRDDGGSNATLASAHEFGVPPNLPARSFLRVVFDQDRAKILKLRDKLVREVVLKNRSMASAREELGKGLLALVLKRFDELQSPPLASSTVEAKGNNTLLVESGQLRASLDYEAQKGRKGR